ncbi:cytochrome c551 [Caldalkalibacillus uzonensis]|uniref:Cytochrome c551 n=1 Tax=Caldalkalibacillus uzonensis TaxID=353224 RepID=A0ABU0CPU5_9BACI|nr:cytochrome c [Caldalkalibacillus uzonensis]MDQ0338420.1 cytochrome c551 [Caldalkalibacillus uzonensis]
MKTKKMGFLLLAFGLMLVLTACGGGDAEAPADDANETEETGADTGEATLVAQGEEAYQKSCISCHGGNLEGGAGPALANLTLSKDEIVEVIKNGQGSMPPNLAPGQEEAIAEYLLSQQ